MPENMPTRESAVDRILQSMADLHTETVNLEQDMRNNIVDPTTKESQPELGYEVPTISNIGELVRELPRYLETIQQHCRSARNIFRDNLV